jgi:AcrR family transcriptional regulator
MATGPESGPDRPTRRPTRRPIARPDARPDPLDMSCILVRMTVKRVGASGSGGDGRARSTSAREAILAAARRQVRAGSGLSIQAIAAEAGVSRQTVHHYFGGAKGLRATLAAEGMDVATAADEPTRERLIEAAIRVMSRPGGGLASIEAIAAEAGLTKGAVYHHFADRGELLRAVARRVSPVDEMREQITPTLDLPPREGLAVIARAYYAAMRSRADLIRNLAANSARDPELAEVVMSEIVGQGAPLMMGWFAYQVSRARLRPVDPSFVIQALFGPVFLLMVLGPTVFDRIAQAGIHPAVDNIEAYVDLLLRGIAPAEESAGGK